MTDDAKRIYQWEQVCKLRTMERDAAIADRESLLSAIGHLQSERDEARASLGRVTNGITLALELINELRGYTSAQWDWKYGERWDAETKAIIERRDFVLPPTTRGK